MKTFKDLEFKPHKLMNGFQALLFFTNGYGVSVVRFRTMSGTYGSFTDDESEWELAVLKGTSDNWSLCYELKGFDDVIGHLKDYDVTKILLKIQELPNAN